MFNEDLTLSFEQQLRKERGYKKELDFRAFKGDGGEPSQPAQVKSTYKNGFGDEATQDEFHPSDWNKSQMSYYQSAVPTLQNKLYDINGADSQARAMADATRANGLKRFGQTMDESLGRDVASVAHRFGSLDNSTMDSALKRFGQAKSDGLQLLQNDYDANYQNNMNSIQGYNMNNLNSALNGMGNLYNLGNGLSQNALSSSNATNNFNNQQYANRLAAYNANLARQNTMFNGLSSVLGNSQLTGAIGNGIGAAGSWLGSLGGAAGTEALSYAPELAMMVA